MAGRAEARGSTRRDATREGILAAALRCFAREGYRRTALDRVAREAGISRAAVYLHFDNKESLFRALVGALHAQTLAEAAAAARGPGRFAERMTAALVAKSGRFFELLRESGHAEEFLDENHRLCGDLSGKASAAHATLLARMLASAARAGEIRLADAGISAMQAAELLLAMAEGIKARGGAVLTTAAYRERLGRAVRVVVGGLTPPAGGRVGGGRDRSGPGPRRRSRSVPGDGAAQPRTPRDG